MPENAIAKVPQALAAYDPQKHNILLPVTHMSDIPNGARLSWRVVPLNPSAGGGDVYALPGGQVGLSKVALAKLAAAAGISVLSIERTDDRRQAHVYGFAVRVRAIDPDGLPREGVGTKEVDYSDGGKDLEEIERKATAAKRDPASQILEARKFAAEICASKAMNRAMRSILALKSSYTPAEVALPYVVPRLILDTNDADAKARILDAMTGAQSRMYPEPQAPVEIEAPKPAEKPAQDPEILRRYAAARLIAKGIGIVDDAWGKLCYDKTGKTRASELTLDDIVKIEAKVSADVDKRAAQDEQVTF